jgi:acyl carrier protein
MVTHLEALLRESIVTICGVPADTVGRDATLDSLGVDSLAAAEILVELEIRLDRELPVDLLRRLGEAATVGDVANLLESTFRGEPSRKPS